MAIRITSLHENHILGQVSQNLVGLQNDIARNAETWKAMALAQSPPLEKLQVFVTDAIAQYRRRLLWVVDWNANAQKKAGLDAARDRVAIPSTDVDAMLQDLGDEVAFMEQASIKSYDSIVALCDHVIAEVPPPPSLWPQ